MNKYTLDYIDALKFIDSSAKENKVYHFNGGQCFIHLHDNWLLILDTSVINTVKTTIYDGTQYLKDYEGVQYTQSAYIRQNPIAKQLMKASA